MINNLMKKLIFLSVIERISIVKSEKGENTAYHIVFILCRLTKISPLHGCPGFP